MNHEAGTRCHDGSGRRIWTGSSGSCLAGEVMPVDEQPGVDPLIFCSRRPRWPHRAGITRDRRILEPGCRRPGRSLAVTTRWLPHDGAGRTLLRSWAGVGRYDDRLPGRSIRTSTARASSPGWRDAIHRESSSSGCRVKKGKSRVYYRLTVSPSFSAHRSRPPGASGKRSEREFQQQKPGKRFAAIR